MEVHISDQLLQLTTAFITGGGMGLWFDLLQPLRQCMGNKLSLLWDLIFLSVSVIIIFFMGQRSGAGMRLFFLCAVAGGFCFYLWSLHDMVSHLLLQTKHFLQIKLGKIKKWAVSLRKSYKSKEKN